MELIVKSQPQFVKRVSKEGLIKDITKEKHTQGDGF